MSDPMPGTGGKQNNNAEGELVLPKETVTIGGSGKLHLGRVDNIVYF